MGVDRGYAAFATRRLTAGELLLIESPTLWVHGHHPFSPAQVDEIERKVGGLDGPNKRAFEGMANVFGREESGGSTAAGTVGTY
jgi:hypothetical protein